MKHENRISGVSAKDLLGTSKSSLLFYPLFRLLRNLVLCDPEKSLSRLSILVRKIIHPLLLLLVPLFMGYKQTVESKNQLLGMDAPDQPLQLPKEPVIWCVNHGFKDDIAASIRATRHSYLFFGSLPHFFNTFDGIALLLNGVILCNRKNREMKKAAFDLSVQALKKGNDVTIFPEGVWNKTPEKLILDLWPGVYRLAKETGCKVVPVIHYLADPHKKYEGNVIHTVVGDPVSMEGLDEQEGLALLRDSMATWYFLMMEKYGQTTRGKLLNGFASADDAWESYIAMHTGCVKYYDREIELCSDYRPRHIVRPETVWQGWESDRNLHAENAAHVKYARAMVARELKRDFQRKF